MNAKEDAQSYRAQVGAFIFNENYELFFVQNHGYPENLWDIVKGGMKSGEEPEQTLKREISEELGSEIEYKVLRRAWFNDIYTWPEEMQRSRGFRGQARISYWVKYLGGDFNIDKNEISNTRWVKDSELKEVLEKGGWAEHEISILMQDWSEVKKNLV